SHSEPHCFLQAEDGIRYATVTGVQTCALPISCSLGQVQLTPNEFNPRHQISELLPRSPTRRLAQTAIRRKDKSTRWSIFQAAPRSEERRVGKGGNARCSAK